MKNKLILFVLVLLILGARTQVNLDSLWSVWNDVKLEDTARLEAIYEFTYNGYSKSKPDSAIYLSKLMLDYAKGKGNIYYQARSYYLLALAYAGSKNNLEAKRNWDHALKIYQIIGDKDEISTTLWKLALTNYNMGQYVAAVEDYSKCLIILRELNDTNSISGILNNIGLIYEAQEDYEKALEYFEQSTRILEEAGSLNEVAVFNMINIYISLGNHQKALMYLNERIKQIESGITGQYYDSTKSALAILNGYGDIYTAQGDYTQAMDYYMRCLELRKKDSLDSSIAYYERKIGLHERKIGLLYLSMKKGELAVEWCSRALRIHKDKDTESTRAQRGDCECLYNSYKLLGDNTRALAYYELFHLLNDSLKLEETAKSLQKMEFAKQMVADSMKVEEERLKTALSHQAELGKKDRAKNIFIISGLIILFIALAIWNRMRFVRKTNARLKTERDRAEKSEQFKHQFLANMSHEIRTPMNAIKGMSDILMRREPKPEQLKYLSGIQESSDSLLVIINDILDLSKIEVGKIDLEHIPFSIEEMIQNVNTVMQLKAEEKGLELKMNIPDTIPQVHGDPARLRQVLINLIGNAIKFTEKGRVTTSLAIDTTQNSDEIIAHFTISDTGIGIDKDKLDQVFESFEQAGADTSRKYGGTGLGLSISKKLVALHQGKIWVESEKGKGSHFHFTIPFTKADELADDETAAATSEFTSMCERLKETKVLLVEDNEFNALVAKEELEDAVDGIVVTVAENGAIAVDQIRQNDFDVILMDVQMPVMNGFEATTAIRELKGDKSKIPILAMTANVMKEEVDRCYETGMDDFIGKPFDTEELIQKIYNLVVN